MQQISLEDRMDLATRLGESCKYLQDNKSLIEQAYARQDAIYTELKSDERFFNGAVHLTVGTVGTITWTYVALVAPPVGALTFSFAMCSTADMLVGAQDIYYAYIGDIKTPTCNPLFEILGENEDFYNFFYKSSAVLFSIAVPAYSVGNAYITYLSDVSSSVNKFNFMSSVVGAVTDAAVDAGVGIICDKLELDPATSLVVSLTAGTFVGSVIDSNLHIYSNGYGDGVDVGYNYSSVYEGGSAWIRNQVNTSALNVDDFRKLKDNGVVKVNSSGSDRPLTGEPNSYYKTGNGEHIFVYDGDGKLIYDISSSRVKGFKINVDPNGVEHYQAYKLEGAVPNEIKELFGW